MRTVNSKTPKPMASRARTNPRRPAAASAQAADVAFSERPISPEPHAGGANGNGINLAARGKDLLSAEAGGVATAVAIGIGAALIEVELLPGLILGAGAILLGKMFPELGTHLRPAVKGAVRAGFALTDKVREIMAEANEQAHDLVAEVKHEREAPPAATAAKSPRKNGSAGDPHPVH